MAFYVFSQNNSGGSFINPAIVVVVEAQSAAEANSKAEKIGVYFNSERDCPCCGSRWDAIDEWSEAFSTFPDVIDSYLTYAKEEAKYGDLPAMILVI